MTQLVILHAGHLAEIKCHFHGWHNIPAERWNFNNNLECPTFSPSIREFEYDGHTTRCHFSITVGKITYHEDNTHEFAGKVLDLLPFTETEVLCTEWIQRQHSTRKEP